MQKSECIAYHFIYSKFYSFVLFTSTSNVKNSLWTLLFNIISTIAQPDRVSGSDPECLMMRLFFRNKKKHTQNSKSRTETSRERTKCCCVFRGMWCRIGLESLNCFSKYLKVLTKYYNNNELKLVIDSLIFTWLIVRIKFYYLLLRLGCCCIRNFFSIVWICC